MVSIFADEVYNETITVNFTDGNDADNEFANKVNFPTKSIDTELGDFTYVLTANVGIEFDPALNLIAPNFSSNNQFFEADVAFNFNNVDLFENLTVEVIKFRTDDNNIPYSVTDGNTFAPIDKYVDVPADLDCNVSTFSSNANSLIDGNQTTDLTTTIQILGRQP